MIFKNKYLVVSEKMSTFAAANPDGWSGSVAQLDRATAF